MRWEDFFQMALVGCSSLSTLPPDQVVSRARRIADAAAAAYPEIRPRESQPEQMPPQKPAGEADEADRMAELRAQQEERAKARALAEAQGKAAGAAETKARK